MPACALREGAGSGDGGFKLAVHVLGASAPGLAAPGLVSTARPRLEAALGPTVKETEAADFVGGAERASSSTSGLVAKGHECPWHFGEALTFAAGRSELVGPGLRMRLQARSGVRLGPVQMEMPQLMDLGEAALDLRRQVLPLCTLRGAAGDGQMDLGGRARWSSPPQAVPLVRVAGVHVTVVGVAVVAFSVNADPEALIAQAGGSGWPSVDEVVAPVASCALAPETCLMHCGADSCQEFGTSAERLGNSPPAAQLASWRAGPEATSTGASRGVVSLGGAPLAGCEPEAEDSPRGPHPPLRAPPSPPGALAAAAEAPAWPRRQAAAAPGGREGGYANCEVPSCMLGGAAGDRLPRRLEAQAAALSAAEAPAAPRALHQDPKLRPGPALQRARPAEPCAMRSLRAGAAGGG